MQIQTLQTWLSCTWLPLTWLWGIIICCKSFVQNSQIWSLILIGFILILLLIISFSKLIQRDHTMYGKENHTVYRPVTAPSFHPRRDVDDPIDSSFASSRSEVDLRGESLEGAAHRWAQPRRKPPMKRKVLRYDSMRFTFTMYHSFSTAFGK